ncbi:guanylate kinase [Diatrype stigma]|uniref:Guanylate kinase n=1 Tax=Diatrype stigma TaxID=117547 RepID=A0AAN9UXQ2_9PEZI
MSSSSPALGLPSDRRPIVIAGPSGVGKGTLYKLLFERHPGAFALSISHTTRAPRPGEQDGVDYYYVTKEAFQDLRAQDKFVESAQFGSNFYGTSKATIAEQSARGRVVVLDIEMEGVKQVQRSDISARYVFVAPPSPEVLERRLRGRGTESEDSVRQRLEQARVELEFGRSGAFDTVIVNDDLETAYGELDRWVYGAGGSSSSSEPAVAPESSS